MASAKSLEAYDYAVIGSGFGGAVSAMRLGEKGYRVLVLERGKRYEDDDLPRTNWNIWKFLWFPPLRCYGIMQISLIRGLMALRWAGVGGGSLGYANVLEVPTDRLFEVPAWKSLANWKTILTPHYETARKMLGFVSAFMTNKIKLNKGSAPKVIGLAPKSPAVVGAFNKIDTEWPDEMSPQRLQEYKAKVAEFRQRLKV